MFIGADGHVLATADWPQRLVAHARELLTHNSAAELREGRDVIGFTRGHGLLAIAGSAAAVPERCRARLLEMADILAALAEDEPTREKLVAWLRAFDPGARPALQQVLRRHHWNLSAAADDLGISRPTLYKYVKRYELRPERLPASLRRARC